MSQTQNPKPYDLGERTKRFAKKAREYVENLPMYQKATPVRAWMNGLRYRVPHVPVPPNGGTVQGSALSAERNPETKETTAVRRWSFTQDLSQYRGCKTARKGLWLSRRKLHRSRRGNRADEDFWVDSGKIQIMKTLNSRPHGCFGF